MEIPLAFLLLSFSNEKNRPCGFNTKIDKRPSGYKRRLEAVEKTIEAMFELLELLVDVILLQIMFCLIIDLPFQKRSGKF